ncbi:hypothetical protein DN752_21315 [Echinicola strongylocentroti]|uniref:Uncharacterized protein n=1 Tax=Echinicola strongylocentroti TaxID=1795355 RepID=A0A2Z4IMZ7_9BACT|nr:hypothetical protein [Echinicola strongylocentroti]AWW32481.1 hypothetical protein DN752_21315 [Echinicola strongylocentroti]
MKAKDFIQLLQLTPKMPIKVEYLPGLFITEGFSISKIVLKQNNRIQVYLSENNPADNSIQTDELHHKLLSSMDHPALQGNAEITMIYGNQEIGETELDITEVEVFQRTFTVKLFSLNNLKKAKERQHRQHKEQFEQKGKRFFFTAIKNFLFPQPLVLKWNLAKL